MKKIPVILCALLLAGLGISGAFQHTSTKGKNIPTEREKVKLYAAVEPIEAPIATIAPVPVESLAATTPTSPFERPTGTTKVDTNAGADTRQIRDDASGLAVETANEPKTEATPAAEIIATAAPQSGDPYHIDVYPNNVYSEELIYDSNGNLIGKTYTYPTAFGSDTIWIDGHAYYDVPGFGLVEWSGPSRRTEDYAMYESGVKVGVMGGEDEAQAHSDPASSQALPDPTGEVIDQTINTRPERKNTPPDYKPELTPPADPNARDIG